MTKFSTPRGTHDILPDDWRYWDFLLCQIREVVDLSGYRHIETPNFAETSLFARTSGAGSDVVDKEMYNFQDRDGDEFSLRPEGTAPVMRAYLQHGMNRLQQPVKLYYVERMYRYDKPQRGRFREHHQFGCEAIGLEDAFVDVEMISLLHTLFKRIGLRDFSLQLNTVGDKKCRPRYVTDLAEYLREHERALAPMDRDRLERNTLRVLDSKEHQSQTVIQRAPSMLDYLCSECQAHWGKLRHGLDLVGIPYEIDRRLVRGLDYYTRTVFEFTPPSEGAQSALAGGGRYDGLSEAIGGPSLPGIGFGSGMERLIFQMRESGVEVPEPSHAAVFIVSVGPHAADAALDLASKLRDANIPTEMAFGQSSMKSQMKKANSSGADVALILHEEELKENQVTLRDLVRSNQQTISLQEAVTVIANLRAGNGRRGG